MTEFSPPFLCLGGFISTQEELDKAMRPQAMLHLIKGSENQHLQAFLWLLVSKHPHRLLFPFSWHSVVCFLFFFSGLPLRFLSLLYSLVSEFDLK